MWRIWVTCTELLYLPVTGYLGYLLSKILVSSQLRQAMCSFVFEALCGFCRRRIGRTVAALSAIDLSADAEAKARNSLDGSLTNSLPALLKGAVDGF